MERNEAPKKIYFSSTKNGTHYYTEGIPFEREYIDYTRTDTFIEKACQFIKEHHHDYSFWNIEEYELEFKTQEFIEDFKKYMEGE